MIYATALTLSSISLSDFGLFASSSSSCLFFISFWAFLDAGALAIAACFFWNRSTLPIVSTNLISPVKNGWHLEQMSTWILGLVDPAVNLLPQAQVTSAS